MKIISTALPNLVPPNMAQILVVEDEYVIAANLQETLEALGYGVLDIAHSATEAVAKAVALCPDLVLMDIRLEGEMDGIQAAEQIWNQLQIPIIYVTGHSDKSTLERVKVTFPFGYLLKPIKGKELYVAIETALNRYEREQLVSAVFRSMGDGIIVTSTQGRILFLNRSAELLTGWQQQDARNRDLNEVFNVVAEDSRLPLGNLAMMAIEQDTILFLNKRILLTTREGITLPITDSVAPIKNRKGLITGAVLVFRDDTHRQEEYNQTLQQTQVLQRQKENLEQLNQRQDDFVTIASHALRTPLINIKMTIRMLAAALDQQGALDSEINPDANQLIRYLNILRDQCTQELSLAHDLLELQQLEAAAHPLWVSIELREWLLQGVAIFEEQAQARGQQLQVILPADLPILISDLSILTRIFTELLINACKYTPPGGAITIRVYPQSGTRIQLIICNTGVDIPANELSRSFNQFHSIPKGDRWQQGNNGFGLALVKKLVSYIGGTIWAESSPGQVCFTVELPLSPP